MFNLVGHDCGRCLASLPTSQTRMFVDKMCVLHHGKMSIGYDKALQWRLVMGEMWFPGFGDFWILDPIIRGSCNDMCTEWIILICLKYDFTIFPFYFFAASCGDCPFLWSQVPVVIVFCSSFSLPHIFRIVRVPGHFVFSDISSSCFVLLFSCRKEMEVSSAVATSSLDSVDCRENHACPASQYILQYGGYLWYRQFAEMIANADRLSV